MYMTESMRNSQYGGKRKTRGKKSKRKKKLKTKKRKKRNKKGKTKKKTATSFKIFLNNNSKNSKMSFGAS